MGAGHVLAKCRNKGRLVGVKIVIRRRIPTLHRVVEAVCYCCCGQVLLIVVVVREDSTAAVVGRRVRVGHDINQLHLAQVVESVGVTHDPVPWVQIGVELGLQALLAARQRLVRRAHPPSRSRSSLVALR